jgi:cyclic pyranopterin phosphate synthase
MLQIAAGLNLEALLDCPLPSCFFKDSQLGWITQYHPKTVSCLGVCNPIMDITPELEVIRCFALSGMQRIKLLDFRNEREIREWFVKNVDDKLLQSGCFEECSDCVHFVRGRCYGGCLAWHKQAACDENKPLALQLIENMGQALEAEKPELALEYFKNSCNWAKTDISKYSAAVAASEVNDWRQVLVLATEADQMSGNRELKQELRTLLANLPHGAFIPSDTNRGTKKPVYVICPNAMDNIAHHE